MSQGDIRLQKREREIAACLHSCCSHFCQTPAYCSNTHTHTHLPLTPSSDWLTTKHVDSSIQNFKSAENKLSRPWPRKACCGCWWHYRPESSALHLAWRCTPMGRQPPFPSLLSLARPLVILSPRHSLSFGSSEPLPLHSSVSGLHASIRPSLSRPLCLSPSACCMLKLACLCSSTVRPVSLFFYCAARSQLFPQSKKAVEK